MASLTLKVQRCFDGVQPREARSIMVTVRGETIEDVRYDAPDGPGDPSATLIDASGRTLLPGLIDAHFHAVSTSLDVGRIDAMHPSLRALDARAHLEGALARGFTTVRDAGGGDIGLVRATERGLIRGPRLLIAGKALSQTGGHGDLRAADAFETCGCGYHGALSAVADGPEQVRQVVRDQLRQGATHIKLFVSGGVLSPTDPIWMNQFTDAEIRAAVEEAATRRTYVDGTCAHRRGCAPLRRERRPLHRARHADGSRKCRCGGCGRRLRRADARRHRSAARGGEPPAAGGRHKLAQVADHAAESVALCGRAGVKLGFGTDLFGDLRGRQADEFAVRGRVQSAIDVLRSATSVNAELIGHAGRLGTVRPGALADLILVDGNPLEDLSVLQIPHGICAS